MCKCRNSRPSRRDVNCNCRTERWKTQSDVELLLNFCPLLLAYFLKISEEINVSFSFGRNVKSGQKSSNFWKKNGWQNSVWQLKNVLNFVLKFKTLKNFTEIHFNKFHQTLRWNNFENIEKTLRWKTELDAESTLRKFETWKKLMAKFKNPPAVNSGLAPLLVSGIFGKNSVFSNLVLYLKTFS